MSTYSEKAERRIAQDLHFSPTQIDLVGRILSLEEETPLVHHILFDYSDASLPLGLSLYVDKPRRINMEVILQKSFRKKDHNQLETRLKEALKTVGVNAKDLFSYCSHSYGIIREDERVEIHFGF